MKSCGLIHLPVRIEKFAARVPFLSTQNIGVDCLLGTSIINQLVKSSIPGLQKLVFPHSLYVAISAQRSLTKQEASLTLELE